MTKIDMRGLILLLKYMFAVNKKFNKNLFNNNRLLSEPDANTLLEINLLSAVQSFVSTPDFHYYWS